MCSLTFIFQRNTFSNIIFFPYITFFSDFAVDSVFQLNFRLRNSGAIRAEVQIPLWSYNHITPRIRRLKMLLECEIARKAGATKRYTRINVLSKHGFLYSEVKQTFQQN